MYGFKSARLTPVIRGSSHGDKLDCIRTSNLFKSAKLIPGGGDGTGGVGSGGPGCGLSSIGGLVGPTASSLGGGVDLEHVVTRSKKSKSDKQQNMLRICIKEGLCTLLIHEDRQKSMLHS
ncbi:MAG: hypothetical protein HQK53_08950 [Oligoflexia bacterium]|nr:hypothetical protein [Oligoflexia bacterium]